MSTRKYLSRKIFMVCLLGTISYLIIKHGWDNDYGGDMEVNINCSSPKFSSVSLAFTGLISMPGSGNTWTRHLLQQATGYYTGSIMADPPLITMGFPGEGVQNGSVIVVKTHGIPVVSHNFQKVIILIRNPFQSTWSFFHLRYTRSHTSLATKVTFCSKFPRFVRHVTHWSEYYIEWLQERRKIPILIVLYDSLVNHPSEQLQRILNFLNIKTQMVQCALNNIEGPVHRVEKFHLKRVYSSENISFINRQIDRLALFISKFNPEVSSKILLWKKPLDEALGVVEFRELCGG